MTTPSGLAATLRDLFEGRPAAPVRIPDVPSPAAPGQDGLQRAVAAWMAAVDSDRAAAASWIRREGQAAAESEGRGAALADAVERLGAAEGPAADELARGLLTEAAARELTARLRGAARDPARRTDLLALAARLGRGMAGPLAEALQADDDRVSRRVLLEGMASVAGEAPEVVETMLRDERWYVVRNAVAVLGEVGDASAVEHLTAALGHDDGRVRREAIMALARIGGSDANQLVVGMLDDPDEAVRSAAAMAAGVLGAERAVRPLLERLEREESDDARVEIVRALGQLGDPVAVPALEKRAAPPFYSRTPAALRIAAYRALAAIGTPHAREVLRAGLDDRDIDVRNAVRAVMRERAGSD